MKQWHKKYLEAILFSNNSGIFQNFCFLLPKGVSWTETTLNKGRKSNFLSLIFCLHIIPVHNFLDKKKTKKKRNEKNNLYNLHLFFVFLFHTSSHFPYVYLESGETRQSSTAAQIYLVSDNVGYVWVFAIFTNQTCLCLQ